MKFDIQHAEATGTVQSAEASTPDIEQHITAGTDAATSLAAEIPHSSVVASAVESVRAEVFETTSQDLLDRVGVATASTTEALNRYSEGDQQMSSTARSNSSSAATPRMPGVG